MHLLNAASVIKDALCQRSFPRINVRRDANVPDVRQFLLQLRRCAVPRISTTVQRERLFMEVKRKRRGGRSRPNASRATPKKCAPCSLHEAPSGQTQTKPTAFPRSKKIVNSGLSANLPFRYPFTPLRRSNKTQRKEAVNTTMPVSLFLDYEIELLTQEGFSFLGLSFCI